MRLNINVNKLPKLFHNVTSFWAILISAMVLYRAKGLYDPYQELHDKHTLEFSLLA
jgi:hypothetical protein